MRPWRGRGCCADYGGDPLIAIPCSRRHGDSKEQFARNKRRRRRWKRRLEKTKGRRMIECYKLEDICMQYAGGPPPTLATHQRDPPRRRRRHYIPLARLPRSNSQSRSVEMIVLLLEAVRLYAGPLSQLSAYITHFHSAE